MKKFKKVISVVLLVCFMGAMTACGSEAKETTQQTAQQDDALQKIKDRGKLICGVRYDVPSFGYENPDTGELEGMEIELVRSFAKEILGDENAVEFVMVTAKTRGAAMDSGTIDCCIATMTTTQERLDAYAASEPYFTDIGAIMVMKDSGIESFSDLEGKIICAPQGTTSTKDALEKAEEEGVSIKTQEFATITDCKAALVAGRADGIVNDTAILNGYLDEDTKLLDERFVKQQYRVWSKKGNDSIIEAANEWLEKIRENGELEEISNKWELVDYSEYEE